MYPTKLAYTNYAVIVNNNYYYYYFEKIYQKDRKKELEDEMKKYGFFRCGKGFLVNMKHVDGVSGGDITHIHTFNSIPIYHFSEKTADLVEKSS